MVKTDNDGTIVYYKIIIKILETHKKINNLIASFNKDTDYKFKEVFEIENRNNYCDDKNCYACRSISCRDIDKCNDLMFELIDNSNENSNINYNDIINKIPNEIENMIKTELI